MKDLPQGWSISPIGEITKVVAGGTPPSKDPANFQAKGGIPWITPADLSGYREMYISHGARNLSESGYAASSAKKMPAGTVLFSSRAPIGYVAIARNEISTNQGFKNFVLPDTLESRFVYYYLRHIKPLAESVATGTTFKELSGAAAAKLPLLVAPLAEQERIADKLDTVLARVDACRERLERIPLILKRFRQSVLKSAFSGELTRDWRANRSLVTVDVNAAVDALFSQGVTAGNFGKRTDRSSQILDEELALIVNNDCGWPLVRIGAVCGCVVPNRDKPKSFSGTYHWLLTHHFHDEKIKFDYSKIEQGLSKDEIDEYGAKIIPIQSVVMSCVGRLGLAAVLEEESVINQQLHAFLPSAYVLPKFLAYVIRANKRYFEATSTSTTVSYLNKTACNSLPIPLPYIAEQAEVVRHIEMLFACADELEVRLTAACTATDRLTPALLAKAFRGELVPQDPNDEPAAELLKRLAATRAPVAKGKRSSKSSGKVKEEA